MILIVEKNIMREFVIRKLYSLCFKYWCYIKGNSYFILYFIRIVLFIIDVVDFFNGYIREILVFNFEI